jgi:rhamnose utilization protein RhaD (predicted bifunctional aldolase and dehydrogenase)
MGDGARHRILIGCKISGTIAKRRGLRTVRSSCLRYRSNLLGADLRITNFGGGNTSSKIDLTDPVSGRPSRVLAVKGSGGDLRSITVAGFALLHQEMLEQLVPRYRGEVHEDEMVDLYPLCAANGNRVAASIDTPLHALLPFAHIDHLHPDWAIAIAASANGERKLQEFNARYDRRLVWVPWQRPGFELAMMLRKAIAANPECDGDRSRESRSVHVGRYPTRRAIPTAFAPSIRWASSSRTTRVGGASRYWRLFVARRGPRSGVDGSANPAAVARAAVLGSPRSRALGSFARRLDFCRIELGSRFVRMGTSCPDHFLRTRICPLFLPSWSELDARLEPISSRVHRLLPRACTADSPGLRDANPSVVVIPGLGIVGFGKDKREARITTEFFVNAIHVMAGATALADDGQDNHGNAFHNYTALPRREAFRIEYWALEEAKLRRQPAEKELSRRIALVTGGGSGIGREVALQMASLGAHVIVADQNAAGAADSWAEAQATSSLKWGWRRRSISHRGRLSMPLSERRFCSSAASTSL